MEGWVKSHRQILNWEWYTDYKTAHLFRHLILVANHKDGTWRGHKIKRGQKITSLAKLSNETGLSIQQIRTSLDKLEVTGEITRKATNQFTLVTIINYCIYQAEPKEPTHKSTHKTTTKQHTGNTPPNNKQEGKNGKNEKNLKKYTEVFEHYLSCDLVKHAKLTKDMKKAIDKALEMYNGDVDLLKRMATRHAEKLKIMKDDVYCPIKRSITVLYGQKKYQSTSLICSDYDDGVWENWHTEKMAAIEKAENLF